MLAAALRARAGTAPREALTSSTAALPLGDGPGSGGSRRLGTGSILLIMIVFGLLGGWIAGWLSTM